MQAVCFATQWLETTGNARYGQILNITDSTVGLPSLRTAIILAPYIKFSRQTDGWSYTKADGAVYGTSLDTGFLGPFIHNSTPQSNDTKVTSLLTVLKASNPLYAMFKTLHEHNTFICILRTLKPCP